MNRSIIDPVSSTPIQHVVLIIQENRTFNNLFAGFPGAVSTKIGKELVGKGSKQREKSIALRETNLEDAGNQTHRYGAYLTAYQNGKMDGFNLIKYVTNGKPEGKNPYQYVNPSRIQPYWDIASHWGLADEMFQTQGSGSFIAHQDLIRGGTFINSTESLIDDPTTNAAWGCMSPSGSKTSLITTELKYLSDKGPFPCTSDFPDTQRLRNPRRSLQRKVARDSVEILHARTGERDGRSALERVSRDCDDLQSPRPVRCKYHVARNEHLLGHLE